MLVGAGRDHYASGVVISDVTSPAQGIIMRPLCLGLNLTYVESKMGRLVRGVSLKARQICCRGSLVTMAVT